MSVCDRLTAAEQEINFTKDVVPQPHGVVTRRPNPNAGNAARPVFKRARPTGPRCERSQRVVNRQERPLIVNRSAATGRLDIDAVGGVTALDVRPANQKERSLDLGYILDCRDDNVVTMARSIDLPWGLEQFKELFNDPGLVGLVENADHVVAIVRGAPRRSPTANDALAPATLDRFVSKNSTMQSTT